MNYGEVKAQFLGALNRRDITASQVEMYIKGALQRAQRLLRVPASEQVVTYVTAEGFDKLFIPGNYLKMVSLTTNHGELRRVDTDTAMRYAQYTGIPRYYARSGAQFIIGPKPQFGDEIVMIYQSDLTSLSADTDENWLTKVAPEVIVNGALAAACRFYVDPRGADYEATFVRDITDLNIQASDDELTNAAIRPAHNMNEEW